MDSMERGMKRCVLLGVLALCLCLCIAGCDDVKTPNEANFTKAIQDY